MRLFVVLFLLLNVGSLSSAFAQTINTTQALDFGEGILMDNTAQREIDLAEDGSYTNDPEIVFTSGNTPVPGIYRLTGDTPFRAISSVTITVDQQLIGPGGFMFTIDDFDIDHPATTDFAGEATIRVGARIRSSGLGGPYPGGGTFTGDLEISVNY